VVELGVALDQDVDLQRALQLVEDGPLLLLEGAGDLGVDPQQQLRGGEPAAQVEELLPEIEADRGVRLDAAAAGAVGAALGEQALQVGAAALAGDLDQAELRDVAPWSWRGPS
jgi:hypothetical protein